MGHESTALGVVPVHLLGIMGARSLINRESKADGISSEGLTIVPRSYRVYQEDRPAPPHARGFSFSLDSMPALSRQLEGQHRYSHTHVPGVGQVSAVLNFQMFSVQMERQVCAGEGVG